MIVRNSKVQWMWPSIFSPGEFRTWRIGVGQALFMVGAPLAWVLRDLLHGGKSPIFTAGLMLFGVALTLDFEALRKGYIRATIGQTGVLLGPIIFLIILALVPLPFGIPSEMDTRALIDLAMMGLVVVAGFSQPVSQFAKMHRAVAIIGAIAAVASILYAISSVNRLEDFLSAGRFGGVNTDSSSPDAGSPVNVGKIAMVTLIAAWIWFRENSEFKLLPAVAFVGALVSALPMFLLARSRTNMIGLFLVIALTVVFHVLSRLHGRYDAKSPTRFVLTRLKLAFGIIAAFGMAAVSRFALNKIVPLVSLAFNFFDKGALSFLTGGTGSSGSFDESAAERRSFLNNSLQTFSLWGHGFKAGFSDNPVLESFYDLGIIGGSFYVLIVVFLPLKICLDIGLRGKAPAYVKFVVASYIGQIPLLFLSRTPYELNNWVFVLILYVVAGRYWSVSLTEQRLMRRSFVHPSN